MKRSVLLLGLVLVCFMDLAQVPQGFNYQAIARDASWNPIGNATLQVRLAVMADSLGNSIYWEELFNPVITNSAGLFTLTMGRGTKEVTSTVATFSNINWSATPLYVRTQIYYQGSWKMMGTTKLWSVPYAMLSGGVNGPQSYLNITGTTALMDSALFVVRNNIGQIIFAVYNEGVRIFVDNGAKGNKGGFAIGSFGTAKAPSQEYFRITKDSARIYVNQNVKGTKGGFAIGGFAGKGTADNYLNLTPNNYFIGQGSGASITTGIYNSFLGFQAGMNNTTGYSNIFIGYQSGLNNVDGNTNLCIGTMTGKSLTNGTNNVFLGNMAGTSNTGGPNGWQGSNNIFIGQSSGASNTTGGSNIFIGTNTGLQNDVGSMNIYVGDYSGSSSKAVRNTFIGASTGQSNTTGNDNIFIGPQTAQNSSTGSMNTIIGSMAGWQNGTGGENTYLGYYAGTNGSNGSQNVFIGGWAGVSTVSGNMNTYIGYHAGAYGSGSKNVFIGYYAGSDETASNRLYIDNNGNNSSNSLIYGEFDTHIIKLNAMVNIRDGLKLVPLSTAPLNPTEGDIYYNGTSHKLMVFDGTLWQPCW